MSNTIKVSTPGDFMMQDPTTGEVVEAYGESTVTRTAWVDEQIAAGKLAVAGKVVDTPTVRNPEEPVRAVTNDTVKRGASQKKVDTSSVKL